MSGAAPGMNQPILIPFNAGGHLGGQQGLVLSLPTANIQSLVAAAAAGGIMTLPLQNLQGKKEAAVLRPIQPKHNITSRTLGLVQIHATNIDPDQLFTCAVWRKHFLFPL